MPLLVVVARDIAKGTTVTVFTREFEPPVVPIAPLPNIVPMAPPPKPGEAVTKPGEGVTEAWGGAGGEARRGAGGEARRGAVATAPAKSEV